MRCHAGTLCMHADAWRMALESNSRMHAATRLHANPPPSPPHHRAGRYQGVPVSVVTTLMGMANMDFVVRECRAVIDGQMAVVRLGTCGALQPPAGLGKMLIASEGAVCVRCAAVCLIVYWVRLDCCARQQLGVWVQ
jgi:hypothetical protein